MLTEEGVSPQRGGRDLWPCLLLVFTLLYGALMVADIYLLAKFARKGAGGRRRSSPLAGGG